MVPEALHSLCRRRPVVMVVVACIGAPALRAQAIPQSLDSIAGVSVQNDRAVGLVAAVVRGNDTLLMNAYGKANLEWDVSMTVDAMFEVGSLAKQFTAAAILQLRDAGKLGLDDEITGWLPEVGADGSGVTLRHLLNHTSGIFNFHNTPEWERNFFIPGVQRDAARDLIQLEPFQFPTGAAQAYNNSGFWLLGLVVERASGMRFEDYVQQEIFDPLGMSRSMYCDGLANVPRRAHGYSMRNGTIRRAPAVWYTWVFAPGAICSTAGDLVTWLLALHGGEVLSADSYEAMTTPATLDDGTQLQYGMGIKVGETYGGQRYIGHGGSAPGFRAEATWYPDEQIAVVVLVNTSPTTVSPGTVAGALVTAARGAPRPTVKYYTDESAPFVGTYEFVFGGNREIAFEVSASPEGLAFSANRSRPRALPWAGGLTFYVSESVTLTFRPGDGDDASMVELRRDDAGNHSVLRRR